MTLLWATLADVLLLTVILYSGWNVVTRVNNRLVTRVAKGFFLILLSYPAEKLVQYMSPPPDQFSYFCEILSIALETTLLFGAMIVVLFNNQRILRTARTVTGLLSLLFLSFAINLSWAWASSPSAADFADRSLAPVLTGHKAAARVVWMVFDEFDQGMAFDHRPAQTRMPNLDQMRRESFYATQATPTARWTMIAMPALLSERALKRVELRGTSDLTLWPESGEPAVAWHSQPTVFQHAREKGLNSAVLGWHHPYCRVLNEWVSDCYWETSWHGGEDLETEVHARRIGFFKTMLFLLEWKGEDMLYALNLEFESRAVAAVQHSVQQEQLGMFKRIREHAVKAVTNPDLDLVVVHWPTPHPYAIYDAAKGEYSTRRGLSYIDNLALVDRTVGEFRDLLAKAGLAENTTLLVSTDHPFRKEVWKEKIRLNPTLRAAVENSPMKFVPFIVRFAGDASPASYDEKWNAVLTGEIVERILDGKIRSARDLTSWLDVNRTRVALD